MNLSLVEYRGSPEIWLGMERKEVDAVADAYMNVNIRIERGEVRPILRNRISQPGIERLPVNEDLTSNPMGKKLMAIHANVGEAGRWIVAPPGVPANVMGILRDSFQKTVKDPELKVEAKKFSMDFDYIPPERCLEVMNDILGQPPEVIKEFSKFVKF